MRYKCRVCSAVLLSDFRKIYGQLTTRTYNTASACTDPVNASRTISGPWRLLFYGNDDFSLASLQVLHENMTRKSSASVVKELDVVCMKSVKAKLSSSCVRQFAIEQGLKIHDWPHSVPMNRYDVGIIVSFGHLIPPATIESFPWGMLNVHPSALPRWRGAAPVNHTILAGDTHAAVTIMQIQPRFDVGPVLKQEIVPVPENCMASKLRQQLAQKGAMMLVDCLEKLPSVVANAKAQSKEGITQAPKLTASMSAVNFCVNTKNDINIRYRALSETFPLHCLWNREPVKLYNMLPLQQCDNLVVESGGEKPPGSSFYHKCRQLLCIKCKDGWVAFGGICPLGKKQMTAKEFYNGFLSKAKFNSVLFTT